MDRLLNHLFPRYYDSIVISKPREAVIEELNVYQSTAMHEAPKMAPYLTLVEQVRTDIKLLRAGVSIDYASPFIWVFGPSGSGKTQFAYSLMAAGCKCLYFVMGSSNQMIYQASRQISGIFDEYIREDNWALGAEYNEARNRKILSENMKREVARMIESYSDVVELCTVFAMFPDLQLKSIGFLHALIQAGDISYGSTIGSSPMSYNQFIKEYKDKETPCVFLDESNIYSKRLSVFAKNLIRALGMVCIVISANTTAKDIRADGYLSERSKTLSVVPRHYVVSRLPKPEFGSFYLSEPYLTVVAQYRNQSGWSQFFDWIESVPTRRPRFFRNALEGLIKYFSNENVSERTPERALIVMLAHMRKELVESLEDNFGCEGISRIQVRSLFGIKDLSLRGADRYSADLNYSDDKTPYFPFHFHYAENSMKCLMRSAKEEMLGNLVLTATPSESGNVLMSYSVSDAYEIFRSQNRGPEIWKTHIREQLHRSAFEHFTEVAAIVTTAEAENRFHGERLDKFCSRFLPNLDLDRDKRDPFQPSSSCQLRALCELLGNQAPIMPLLGPINDDYKILKKVVSKDLNIAKLCLSRGHEPFRAIIRTASWNFFICCEYPAGKLTCDKVQEIVKNVVKYDWRKDRRVIFIITPGDKFKRSGFLKFEKSDTCYFECTGGVMDAFSRNQIKFVSRSKVSTRQAVLEVKTIVILISLESIFGVYDIDKIL